MKSMNHQLISSSIHFVLLTIVGCISVSMKERKSDEMNNYPPLNILWFVLNTIRDHLVNLHRSAEIYNRKIDEIISSSHFFVGTGSLLSDAILPKTMMM